MPRVSGPHQSAATDEPCQQFAAALLDRLWERFRERVSYVRDYEQVVERAGATFHNDHIALRTIASQIPLAGISTVARLFESLGWHAAGVYQFPDKALNAVHFEHPNRNLPKIFISELQLWQLADEIRERVLRSLRTQRLPVSDETLARLARCGALAADEREALLARIVREFHELPWTLPEKEDVVAVNEVSQYAAWVLLHGYNVNHFTSLINSHGVPTLDSIEKTVAALTDAGVPLKAEIEGRPGSRLRQTATAAVVLDVPVSAGGVESRMAWPYAYFELAERAETIDPDTGERRRFEGFLGAQATHLFEMTRRSAS